MNLLLFFIGSFIRFPVVVIKSEEPLAGDLINSLTVSTLAKLIVAVKVKTSIS